MITQSKNRELKTGWVFFHILPIPTIQGKITLCADTLQLDAASKVLCYLSQSANQIKILAKEEMLAKVPSILPILIATINHQNSACKGCYCTVGAWPFLAILMYAKAILSILADTILILFNTDVINCSDGCEGAVNLGTLYRTVVESRHPLTRDLPPPWIVEASHNHGHPGNYGLHT